MEQTTAGDDTVDEVEESPHDHTEPLETETSAIEALEIEPLEIAALEAETPAPASLMDSTSPQALLSGQEAGHEAVSDDVSPAPSVPEPTPDVFDVADDAASGSASAASEDPIQSSLEQGVSAPDMAEPACPLPAEFESAIAFAEAVVTQPQRIVAVTALSEITAANDTLAIFLRNEGIATVAHWRALSTAKTPADAIRLQVGEMQRVADASLNCMASLARRAGRIAATVVRA